MTTALVDSIVLDAVRDSSRGVVNARNAERMATSVLEQAIRNAARQGETPDAISAASGVTTAEIHRIMNAPVHLEEDLPFIA